MLRIKTLSSKLIVFTILLVSIIIIYFNYFRLIPAQKKSLYTDLYNRAQTASDLSKPLINKAIDLQDDLLLLSQIESILKLDELTTAYIVDGAGKVIMHNKTSEWDKEYTDEYTKKSIASKKNIIQKTNDPNIEIFSSPVTESLTLCIGLTTVEIKQKLAGIKRNMFFSLLIVLIIAIILIISFMKIQISSRFKSFENMLRSSLLGRGEKIEIKSKDELAGLAGHLNDIIEKYNREDQAMEKSANEINKNISLLIRGLINNFTEGAIAVFNSENKLIALSSKFSLALNIAGDSVNKHILEIPQIKPLADAFKDASSKPNSKITANIDNKTIELLTVFNNTNKYIGTIIYFRI
ncbi:MAG: hypothetical protein ABH857_00385 [Elusimicrobiota bacterium]